MAKRLVSNEAFFKSNPKLTDSRGDNTPLGIFVRAFIACALWTSDEEVGSSATLNQFDRTSLESVIEQCQQFIHVATERGYLLPLVDMSQAGHDFWLTRAGHGAGFWDRDDVYGEGNGDKLTELCGWHKMFNEFDLQKEGRGKIHIFPLYNSPTQGEKYEALYKHLPEFKEKIIEE